MTGVLCCVAVALLVPSTYSRSRGCDLTPARSPGSGQAKAPYSARCAGYSCVRGNAGVRGCRGRRWRVCIRRRASHVWVDGKWHRSGLPKPLDEMVKAHGGHWSTSLSNEHMGFCAVLTP